MEPDYAERAAYPGEEKPLPEPMHQRVTVLEKQVRELMIRLASDETDMREFAERTGRELGF